MGIQSIWSWKSLQKKGIASKTWLLMLGIRMALGAQPRNILAMMLRQGTVIVAVGLLIGIAGALAAAKLVSNLLVISGTDPATYVAVSAFLTLVALAACYIPARRTMRVDPTVALRYE